MISLESFRSSRGPLFRKPVTGQKLFFPVSYSKPALVLYISLETRQPILSYWWLAHLFFLDLEIFGSWVTNFQITQIVCVLWCCQSASVHSAQCDDFFLSPYKAYMWMYNILLVMEFVLCWVKITGWIFCQK